MKLLPESEAIGLKFHRTSQVVYAGNPPPRGMDRHQVDSPVGFNVGVFANPVLQIILAGFNHPPGFRFSYWFLWCAE